jgi:hypothetical protein
MLEFSQKADTKEKNKKKIPSSSYNDTLSFYIFPAEER